MALAANSGAATIFTENKIAYLVDTTSVSILAHGMYHGR